MVTTGEVLAQIQGLTYARLYYFEAKGFIKPRKVSSGKLERNDYSKDDLQLIKSMQYYCDQGFTPKVAHQKAMAEQKTPPLPLR